MSGLKVVFMVIALISISMGIIPLLPYVLPIEVESFIPNQTLICIITAIVLGALSGMKGATIGWLGVVLGILAAVIELVYWIIGTSSGPA